MKTGLRFVFVFGIIAAAVAFPLVVHHRGQAQCLEQEAALKAQAARLVELSAENDGLSNAAARLDNAALTGEQHSELLRLRGQMDPLRRAARELEQLK